MSLLNLFSAKRAALGLAILFLFCAPARAQQSTPIVDPKADALLKQMSQTLAAAKEISFVSSTLTDEVTSTGQKIQYSKRSTISLKRPDAVRSIVKGDRENFTVIYDGKSIVLFDPATNIYATAPMPPTIDAAVDALATKYGIIAPVADLLFSNPYESFVGHLEAGVYLGEHDVNGVSCHHLAFRTAAVDWQIWIETGARPLPRKLVITYKQMSNDPQFIAFLDEWNLQAQLAPDLFKFTPPAGAKKVDLAPLPEPTTQPGR
jgi:hypothetical protein